MGFNLQFEGYAFLSVLICLLIAAAYSLTLYYKTKTFNKPVRVSLGILRGLLVFILALLLFNPLINHLGKTVERPVIVIAQDNSASVPASSGPSFKTDEYLRDLRSFKERLSADYDVKFYRFGDSFQQNDTVNFSDKRTNISAFIKEIRNSFEHRNLGAVVIASDGIYNQGADPLYEAKELQAPVYTVALGDTIPRKDLVLQNVSFNNIVYLGNNYPLNVLIAASKLNGQRSRLLVRTGSKQAFTKEFIITGESFSTEIPVVLSADEAGMQKIDIEVVPVEGERTISNNKTTVFVDVIDGKQKILLLANAPHPDLAAIKQSIEQNRNYEVKLAYASSFNNTDLSSYQLCILHQLPSSENPSTALFSALSKSAVPLFFIIGNQTYIDLFNRVQSGLTISNSRSVYNEALATVKSDFYLFTLSDEATKTIRSLPPLNVPYGVYKLNGNFSSLLEQRIGSVQTTYPLLTYGQANGAKMAYLSGEGFWKWRLQDFRMNQSHFAVDELMSKSIQYLSAKDDKRKFRVKIEKPNFDEDEQIRFDAELYNDSYQAVNTPEVRMTIKNRAAKLFEYTFSRTEQAYRLNAGSLPVGDYTYLAKTKLGANEYTAEGKFSVSQLNYEELNVTADHHLLNVIASATGAEMVYPGQFDALEKMIRSRDDLRSIAYEENKTEELIDLKWIFFTALALVSLEWFIRKREGAY